MNDASSANPAHTGKNVEPRRKLGRGLGALLGDVNTDRLGPRQSEKQTESHQETSDNILKNIPLSAIEPLQGQPRTYFDDEALEELAASIRAKGVIQPIIVRRLTEERFQLVAGERRWRAAQKAQLHDIPAIVRDLSSREVMTIALIENLQREDLNPIEEAKAYSALTEDGMTQSEIAQTVDKSRSHIANLMRLLALPEAVQELAASGQLSMGHARALIGHENATELAKEAVRKGLSVREVERRAKVSHRKERKIDDTALSDGSNDADILAVQNQLEEFLGLPVRIETEKDPARGAVTIRYRTLDQLDLVCQRLTGGSL